MSCLRAHALPPQHLQPAVELKEIVRRTEDPCGLAEELDAMSERIRNRRSAARIPEGFASSIVRVIVQQDEIANVFVLRGSGPVEFATTLFHIATVREQQDQSLDTDLDQMNRRGLERLDESAGES